MAKRQITSNSPLSQQIDLVTYELKLDGSPLEDIYQLHSIKVNHKINRIATAELVILDVDPADQELSFFSSDKVKPGTEVEISLGYHVDNEIVFKGIITKVGVDVNDDSHSKAIVYCSSKAIKTTLYRSSSYFIKQKDDQIIKSIANKYGLNPSVDSTSFQHKELIQYNSTDWDFMLSRADINGLWVYQDKDDKLQVKKPAVSGSSVIALTFGVDIIKSDLMIDSTKLIAKVECSSWDQDTQKMVSNTSQKSEVNNQGNTSTKVDKLAEVIKSEDFTITSTAPIEKSLLKTWAQAKVDKSGHSRYQGSVTCNGNATVELNKLVEIAGLGDYFNGYGLVTGVVHKLQAGEWTTKIEFGLSSAWHTEEYTNISLPDASGMLPGIQGLCIGVVKKIDGDPDNQHRVQVDIPVIEESGDGVWARLSSFFASNKHGAFFYPQVGDEVILGFLNNDPTFPIILGSLYSKKNTPPFTADKDNSTQAIVTKNLIQIVLNDKDKIVEIETPSKNKITLSDKDKSITLEDQNKNKVVLDNKGILLDTMKDINLKAKGKVVIDATTGLELKSKADLKGEGLNVSLKANVKMSAEGTAMGEFKSSGQTTVKGAIVMIN
ncbi:MAG: type VI secretion system tip protein VgrG [Bacteroidota bacterium]